MSRDPYRYFRVEAQELVEGLAQGVIHLEKGASVADVGRMLREAHTLKGAARVVKLPEIAEWAHLIEDLLQPYREGGAPLQPGHADKLLDLLDAIRVLLARLDQSPARPAAPGAGAAPGTANPVGEERFDTVHVGVAELDEVLERVSEAGVQLVAARRRVADLDGARAKARALLGEIDEARGGGNRALGARASALAEELLDQIEAVQRRLDARLDRGEREVRAVRDSARRSRLMPARVVFASLERAVRDAARSLDKEAELVSTGGDIRLDAHVLSGVRDAMLHVVRNAVAHGIEPRAARLGSGKPALGRVELTVRRGGDRVTFVCRDDGAGIDLAAVRRVGVERGLLDARRAGTLDEPAAVRLLLRGGLSTASHVSEVSGRGVGLDVVREVTSRLNGDVRISSEAGRGTTVALTVPMSLSSLSTLEVEVSGTVVQIPLDSVRETLLVAEDSITHAATGASIVHDAELVPFMQLSTALSGQVTRAGAGRPRPVVVVAAGDQRAAVGVDRLLGVTRSVVRSLPDHLQVDPVVAGVVLDVDGVPQLVLDPYRLVRTAHSSAEPSSRSDERRLFPVLVVDDSLTTRMLEQSILESAGYDVEIATSAEDGLDKARRRRFGVFIVDVEMPGMNGYEFVAQTRAEPDLAATPAILVTSRGSPEDKQRGIDAGACTCIVKSEFDQEHLLATIRGLMG